MDNAPTRPPNRPWSDRRSPRGPHVARKSDVDRNREHLLIGAEALQDSLPEVSTTLRNLAQPYGYRMLTVDRATGRVPDGTTNVTMMVPEHLRTAIHDAAMDAADADGARLQDLLGPVLSNGFRRVLDGQVTVREIGRDPRGTSAPKVNLNVPVNTGALQELREGLARVGERMGFRSKASVTQIALRLLLDEYGLEYEPAPNIYKDLAQMQLPVPPRLAAEIRRKLADTDTDLRTVVEEGFRKVLDGVWEPMQIPKAAKGSDYERDTLAVRVNDHLLEQVRAKCPKLKKKVGIARVTAPTIAIDYLIDDLGLQELADAEYGITAE